MVRILVDCVSKDGNPLLNVGPDGRGAFEPRARSLLAAVDADGNLPPLRAAGPPGSLVLDLPARRPDVLVPVVEVALS